MPSVQPGSPATRPRPPRRRLIEHALSLIGRQQHGEPREAEAARRELAEWRKADPAHESAFEMARQYWDATEAGALKNAVPLPRRRGERETPGQRTRRRALAVLGLAGLAATLGAGARWAGLLPLDGYTVKTGQGQLLGHDLPDGSHIDLAANTAARVRYYRDRREIMLANGEMRFDVRPDAARPFVVATSLGRVAVLGTVFSVTVHDERMRIEVARGRVAVWAARRDGRMPGADSPPDMVLEARDAVEVDGHRFGERMQIQAESVGAWCDGWLVFNATPLPEAIARWNDYLPRPLRLADRAELRGMRLTGSFPARDPDAFLQNLPDILPVHIAPEGQDMVLYPRH